MYPTEPVVGVKAGGLLVDRVDDNESRRHHLSHGDHSSKRLGEERAADALVLKGFVKRQPSEQHGWDLTRTASPNRGWQFLALQ